MESDWDEPFTVRHAHWHGIHQETFCDWIAREATASDFDSRLQDPIDSGVAAVRAWLLQALEQRGKKR